MTVTARPHPLQSIFHPHWTPSDDIQLLKLRDEGVALDRIAMAMMRRPKAIEQRWHRLRVVPNVRKKLRTLAANSAKYLTENHADLVQPSGGAGP